MTLRALLILATMVLGVLLLSGVVLAKTCHATCYGDNGPNTLIGTNSTNRIYARGGEDVVNGLQNKDLLKGERGRDELTGGRGVDTIFGGTGYDWLIGKQGGDDLTDVEHVPHSSTARSKQRTVDVRIGSRKNRKVDVLIGGPGNDTIRAKDGKRDIIRGGPGRDTAYVDQVDNVTGVEVERCPGGCNEPPVAKDDSYSVNEDTVLRVVDGADGVLSNDTDADNPNNTNAGLTVKDADSTTPGVQPETGPAHGTLTLNADGSFEYRHTGRCSSKQPCPPDSFTYKATDGAADSKAAKVNITVCQFNGPNPPAGCPPP
jgi:VCBS repeat-containing protein